VDDAVVVTEHAAVLLNEAKSPIEGVRPRVCRERVDNDGGDTGIREAEVDCLPHHLCPVTTAPIARMANPDVNGSQIGVDCSPVMGWLKMRVDHQHGADRAAVQFRDQVLEDVALRPELGVPVHAVEREFRIILVGRGGDDVGVGIPYRQLRNVVDGCRSQPDSSVGGHAPLLPVRAGLNSSFHGCVIGGRRGRGL
jgi:hypothetical protein